MKHRKTLLTIWLGSLLSTACATATTDPLTQALDSGFEVVQGGALTLIGDNGVTYRDVDDGWINYLSADGRKVVKNLSSGEITQRSWRTNEDGVFCQLLARSGEEQCEGEDIVYLKNASGIHNIIIDGKNTNAQFTVTEGNPENL